MRNADLQRAISAINSGQFAVAARLLRPIAKAIPENADVQYLTGVALQAVGETEAALTHYSKAIQLNPDHQGAHYNAALALSALGRHLDALAHHNQAIRLMPGNHWALVNRGNSYAATQQYALALQDYDAALQIKPDLPEALTSKGSALMQMRAGTLDDVLSLHQRAVELAPSNALVWMNLSATFVMMERFAEAIDAADRAIQLQPTNVDALVNKGAALIALDQAASALPVLEEATRLAPSHALAWTTLGNAQEALHRYEEAITSYNRSHALAPDGDLALINKGSALDDLNRDAEAEACYRQGLATDPNSPELHWNLALLLLKQHRFIEAWPHFEYRWHKRDFSSKPIQTTRPRWNGEWSHGSILFWGEQGLGDQILYSSVLPNLTSLPQRKMVALDRRLIPLYARSFAGFDFVDLASVSDAMEFAMQLPLGSLPGFFRPDLASFERAQHPYLRANPSRRATLRQQIERPGKLVCGVSWRSSRKSIGKYKSISLESLLRSLVSDQLHFVNLQYGDTAAERNAVHDQHGIEIQNVDEVDNFQDLDGLAALIDACDVIVTTSNTTAHLAGALGKQTLLLLPAGKGRLWYWTEHEGRNLWYPSITICQQKTPGDWEDAIAAIRSRLGSLAPK